MSALPDLPGELSDQLNDYLFRTPPADRPDVARVMAGKIVGFGVHRLGRDRLASMAGETWSQLGIVPEPQPGRRRGGGRRRK